MSSGAAILLPAEEEARTRQMLLLVYFIYFFCGMTQSFEGSVLPEIKTYFHLNYQQQMYAIFAKNFPFLAAPLLGGITVRLGFGRLLAIAMALYAVGTLLLVPSLSIGLFPMLLWGFLVLGSGFTLQMIAGNPLIVALGKSETSSSRLQFGNALGAVAQIVAPAMLSLLIPGATASIADKISPVKHLLSILGGVLAVVCVVAFWIARRGTPAAFPREPEALTLGSSASAWRDSGLPMAAAMLLLLLGSEASLFSFFRNYLEDVSIVGVSAKVSQRFLTAYFASFALGRLSASWLQRVVLPLQHLLVSLAAALLLTGLAVAVHGTAAIVVMLVIGFVVSTLFPTLYDLALKRAGPWKAQAAGILTVGFLGSALFPVLQGRLADTLGLQRSYACEAAAYLVLLGYALRLGRDRDFTALQAQ